GGKVSNVYILSSGIGNGLPKGTVDEDDQPEDDKPEEETKVVDETIATDEAKEESKVIEQTVEDIEDAKKENGESAEENTVDMKPDE
ncbi:hypothetical protein Tco_1372478, partial [Tanacetum coccineum]